MEDEETIFEQDILDAYGITNEQMNNARRNAVASYRANSTKSAMIAELAKKYGIPVEAAISCAFVGVLA